ncbi:PRC and DUF2382 domain-containing protein [uncultured Ornithinimicrobium sp.]|uniref:PRC and DUF2382 domain-containing protein n=1 Tax=uncultured Ornithinimicrobium sp. TaxID=259307 RepID=UPI002593883B|nr:PRC and DUF2382 domain-containing protein [uncultured Ornithinimicrobium sp.]
MRITQEHIDQLYNADVVDRDGDSLGGVGQVYLDDNTGDPAWVTVKTGFFGTKETFVPLTEADYGDGTIRLPYEKGFIKDAPNMEADQHLSESEQDELYRYYEVQGMGGTGRGDVDREGFVDRDRDGRADDVEGNAMPHGAAMSGGLDEDRQDLNAGGDVARQEYAGDARGTDEGRMTLHEERVDVGTERVQTGRVRLRKHVVTDQKTVTVPVEREEYEVVREPVTDGGTADRGDLGDDEVEVAVHEERPVIDKDVVATEEVGVQRTTVTDERDVTTDVAHEEVDVVQDDDREGLRDGDVDPGRRT